MQKDDVLGLPPSFEREATPIIADCVSATTVVARVEMLVTAIVLAVLPKGAMPNGVHPKATSINPFFKKENLEPTHCQCMWLTIV